MVIRGHCEDCAATPRDCAARRNPQTSFAASRPHALEPLASASAAFAGQRGPRTPRFIRVTVK
jgi:hypothetical protein